MGATDDRWSATDGSRPIAVGGLGPACEGRMTEALPPQPPSSPRASSKIENASSNWRNGMVNGGQSVTTSPSADLEAEPGKAAIHEPFGRSGWIITADLHAEIATEASRVLDEGMVGLHRAKPLEAAASEFLSPIDQPLLFDDFERREPSGASDGLFSCV